MRIALISMPNLHHELWWLRSVARQVSQRYHEDSEIPAKTKVTNIYKMRIAAVCSSHPHKDWCYFGVDDWPCGASDFATGAGVAVVVVVTLAASVHSDFFIVIEAFLAFLLLQHAACFSSQLACAAIGAINIAPSTMAASRFRVVVILYSFRLGEKNPSLRAKLNKSSAIYRNYRFFTSIFSLSPLIFRFYYG